MRSRKVSQSGRRCGRRRGYGLQRNGVSEQTGTAPTAARDGDDHGSLQQKIELLREKVKYVFVIFHENESFDHYFGTFPGANGLFEAPDGFTPANQTPSFTQRYLDTSLNVKTISPFLMPQAVVSADRHRSSRSIRRTRFPSITATRAWRTTWTSIRRPGSRPTTAMRWIKRV